LWAPITESFCHNSKPISFITKSGYLYYDCQQLDGTVTIERYKPGNATWKTNLENLFAGPTNIQAMCSFKDNVFVAGNFDYAGNKHTSQNIVIWSNSTWIPLEIENLPTHAECQSCVSCSANHITGNLEVAFLFNIAVNSTPESYLQIATISHANFEVMYSRPFLITPYQVSSLLPKNLHCRFLSYWTFQL
jgi:hypothetical protein